MARGGHENCFCTRHQAECMSGFVANSISVFCAAFSLSKVDSRGWLGGTIKVFPHLKCSPIDLIPHARKYINPPGSSLSIARPGPFRSRVFPVSFLFDIMCIECVPPELVDLTPHDHEKFFRVVGGRRCNTLNDVYIMPADEDELRVRSRVSLTCVR